MTLLELVNLTKYFGRLRAVNKISLTVEEGEIRGLIGPNGSGKTTIFNLISGFIHPTQGRIFWQGQSVEGASPHAIAKKGIARTFQLTNIFKEKTVLENLMISYHLKFNATFLEQFLGTNRAKRQDRACWERSLEILEFLQMTDQKDRIAGELPGGSQRILAIAIALVFEPRMLMLDEPLAGMNPAEKKGVTEKIEEIRRRGITVVLVEHDMKTIMNICDKITVIDFGTKIAEGTPANVGNDQRTIEAYLGKQEPFRAGN